MAELIPDEFLDVMAEKFRLLGDSTRLAILRALMAGEKCVGRVVEETGRGQANVSKHLKLLADAGLVARRKEGLQIFYRVDDPVVAKLCKLVCETIMQETRTGLEVRRKLLKRLGGTGGGRPATHRPGGSSGAQGASCPRGVRSPFPERISHQPSPIRTTPEARNAASYTEWPSRS
jgi:ArsR family transcriptional regulator